MAKISEQKKVELMEEAVLRNDIEGVKALFAEHGTFEFTARALGLALRFCGADMTKALIEGGATLEYELSPAFKRKYACAVAVNNFTDIPVNYSSWIFPGKDISDTGFTGNIVSDEERKKEARILHEKGIGNLQMLLYNAIYYDDDAVYEKLRELGVNRLSDYGVKIAGGKAAMKDLFDTERYDRRAFQYHVLGVNNKAMPEEATLRKLKHYLECMDEEKILLFPADVYITDWMDKKHFVTRYCSETLFDFMVNNTNLAERAKKWDMLYALVDKNNASGLQYALSEKWISKPKDIETLLAYAQGKDVKPELMAALLDKQHSAAPVKAKKKAGDEFTLETKQPSAAEMKKIWGFKKQEDGTLIITSYKGTATEVVIPSTIGKDTVTAIDPDAFRVNAPRLTREQTASRKAIVSVEVPGTVKAIPGYMFGREAYSENGHDALKKVILDEGVEAIGEYAFAYCKGLETVDMPGSVTSIGSSAFKSCVGLKDVRIPRSVTAFPDALFYGSGLKEYAIPAHIKEFGGGIFSGCELLEEITLPETMMAIPDGMFLNCLKLEAIDLPADITEIGRDAFRGSGLKEIRVPGTVKKIGGGAFSDCKNLESIHLPDDAEIGQYAFAGCNHLADEDGQIIVGSRFYGVVREGWVLEPEEELKPVRISPDVVVDAALDQLPAIVYRACVNDGDGPQGDLQPGNTVRFGMFPQKMDFDMEPLEWHVLAAENGKALLLSEKALISISDRMKQKDVWAGSYVRELLNNGFYDMAFSEKEKEKIITVMNKTGDNKAQKVKGGPDTQDRIFLLSLEEVEQYLPDPDSRKCSPTDYAHYQHPTRRDYGYWQLRTPGKDGWGSMAISQDGNDSASTGNHTGYSYLRPAVWVKAG